MAAPDFTSRAVFSKSIFSIVMKAGFSEENGSVLYEGRAGAMGRLYMLSVSVSPYPGVG
jgi:hypothetical protein